MPSPWAQALYAEHHKPAAELTCACGHLLCWHDRPSAEREPWGACKVIVNNDGQTQRCSCAEAWPMEEPE